MKRNRVLLILFAIVLMFTIFTGIAAAQSVDVDSMSNEELMVLLQSIMRRLEQDTETTTDEKKPETDTISVTVSTEKEPAIQEVSRESQKHSIYKNKKLVIGRMPDSWFIRKQPGGGGGDDEGGSEDTHTFEFHYGDYTFTVDIPDSSFGEYGIPTDVWKAW